MALLFIDGFDHYVTADILKKWSAYTGAAILTTSGRRGGGALEVGKGDTAQFNFTSTLGALICGFAVKVDQITSRQPIVQFLDSVTPQVSVNVNPDGSLEVRRGLAGGTVLSTSLPGVAQLQAWFYLEVKAVFGNTTGAFEVRVNGNTVITATNVDTQDSANAYATMLKLYVGSTDSGGNVFDDFYLLDTSGTTNNDFLGDVRVDAYYPTSEGTVQAWTPTPTGTHYTTVDETAPNLTDYVSSATVGNKELFGVTDLVNTPLSIFGVQANSAAWKTDAGLRAIKNLVRIAGTDYPSSAINVAETQRYACNIWEKNPATSAAWTDTAVNGAEFGVEVA